MALNKLEGPPASFSGVVPPPPTSMELNGKGREELQKALLAAFPTHNELAQFVDFKFDLSLGTIAGDGAMNEVVYRLMSWARAEGRLEELAVKAREHKLHNPELRAFAEQYFPTPAAKVNVTLNALVRLVQLPEVQEALVGSRADLRTASRQIIEMKNYKELHNLLHDLLVFCYNPVMLSLRQLQRELDNTRNPVALRQYKAWSDLETHALQLENLIDDFRRDIKPKDCFDPNQITLINTALVKGLEYLKAAFELKDLKTLYSAAFQLERVIGTQQPPINTRINTLAGILNLPGLVKALSAVSERIREMEIETEEARQFITGVVALADLNSRLQRLISEHNLWQFLDHHLRQVDPEIGVSAASLQEVWPIVWQDTKKICCGSRESWARNLRRYRIRLSAALRANNPSSVESAYNLYRSQTIDRFYRVDKDLNLLCEELTRIGNAPLDAVSRVLERGQG